MSHLRVSSKGLSGWDSQSPTSICSIIRKALIELGYAVKRVTRLVQDRHYTSDYTIVLDDGVQRIYVERNLTEPLVSNGNLDGVDLSKTKIVQLYLQDVESNQQNWSQKNK